MNAVKKRAKMKEISDICATQSRCVSQSVRQSVLIQPTQHAAHKTVHIPFLLSTLYFGHSY
jgi:hypothetical protein